MVVVVVVVVAAASYQKGAASLSLRLSNPQGQTKKKKALEESFRTAFGRGVSALAGTGEEKRSGERVSRLRLPPRRNRPLSLGEPVGLESGYLHDGRKVRPDREWAALLDRQQRYQTVSKGDEIEVFFPPGSVRVRTTRLTVWTGACACGRGNGRSTREGGKASRALRHAPCASGTTTTRSTVPAQWLEGGRRGGYSGCGRGRRTG